MYENPDDYLDEDKDDALGALKFGMMLAKSRRSKKHGTDMNEIDILRAAKLFKNFMDDPENYDMEKLEEIQERVGTEQDDNVDVGEDKQKEQENRDEGDEQSSNTNGFVQSLKERFLALIQR